MLHLTDPWFEAEFYNNARGQSFSRHGDRVDGAQGLFLWCPCGYGKSEYPLDGGRPHGLIVPFENPRNAPLLPTDHGPISRDGSHRPRWTMTGTGLNDLTLTPSVDVEP